MSAFPLSPRREAGVLSLCVVALALSGCATTAAKQKSARSGSLTSRDCLARAMYFESNRSSDHGMLAVGTVVMNRYEAKKYGSTVCGVVGAKNQFAPGVLSRAMTEPKSQARAYKIAGDVLAGRRHPKVGKAEFFHTAGYEPGYNNMRYVSIEGGNAFYEKVKKGESTGDLVRVARRGPARIDDIIAVQETTMLAAGPVVVPPPVAEVPEAAVPSYPAPAVAAAPPPSRRTASASYPPPPAASAETAMPGPELGWQVGPPGRLY